MLLPLIDCRPLGYGPGSRLPARQGHSSFAFYRDTVVVPDRIIPRVGISIASEESEDLSLTLNSLSTETVHRILLNTHLVLQSTALH